MRDPFESLFLIDHLLPINIENERPFRVSHSAERVQRYEFSIEYRTWSIEKVKLIKVF